MIELAALDSGRAAVSCAGAAGPSRSALLLWLREIDREKPLDVAAWLAELGLERYVQAFLDNDIAPAVLPELSDQDLKDQLG